MANAYIPTRFEVTGQVPPFTGPLEIAAWVFAPPTLAKDSSPIVLVSFPGASYTKTYYHLEVPGYPVDAYSFGSYMARQGFVVVAIDHLGIGESTHPANGTLLTLGVVAQANEIATRQIRTRLNEGTLLPQLAPQKAPTVIGIGHSMGSYVLITQQAEHHSFDAIAPLGYTNRTLYVGGTTEGSGESSAEGQRENTQFYEVMQQLYQFDDRGYAHLKREIVHSVLHATDVPEQVIAADDAQATHVPVGILADINGPDVMLAKAAKIDVPVFLSNATLDVSGDLRAEPATYPGTNDITLFELAGSAHDHNFATTRELQWSRIVRWIGSVAPQRA